MEDHNFENEGQFQRKMTSRHLLMLSLGDVIGTGLLLSPGYTIAQAGPSGAVLSYLVGAAVVYLVMLFLGELAVAMPVIGPFHIYATKSTNPGTGSTVAWLYQICWTVALGTEFLGVVMLIGHWSPSVSTWLFATLFVVIIFVINVLSVHSFAEAESFFASTKVIAVIVLTILGLGAMLGLVSFDGEHKAILFTNLTVNGAFPRGITAVISVMLVVNHAFFGTELIGIAAGETDNPKEAVPKVIKTTIGRLVIFFVLAIVVLAPLLPMREAGASTAPLVDVFDKMEIPFAADIMNFVILTVILSAGNLGLYVFSRILWSLVSGGMLSKKIVKINEHGVPMYVLLLSMAGTVLSLLSNIYAADTVYLAPVSIAGFAIVVVWSSIPMVQIDSRKASLKKHSFNELSYQTPFTPVLPYITIILLVILVIGTAWDALQRTGLYFGTPFVILCYVYHYLCYKKWWKGSTMGTFEELLASQDYVILNGTLGTELEKRGYDVSGKLWSAKYLLENPSVTQDLHDVYLRSGVDTLIISSYQATVQGLKDFGSSEKEALDITSLMATPARQARDIFWSSLSDEAKKKRPYPLISGDVGFYAAYLADGSEYNGNYQLTQEEYQVFHHPRIRALLPIGSDFLGTETISNVAEAKALLDLLATEFSQTKAYTSFTAQDDKYISDGTPVEEVAALCEQNPQILVSDIGCNNPAVVSDLLKRIRTVSPKKSLVTHPNSGEAYDGVTQTWKSIPDDSYTLPENSRAWYQLGVKIVGGCRRISPENIVCPA